MSKIIKFPLERKNEVKHHTLDNAKATNNGKCDVIIFPGVRIERQPRTLSQHASALHALRKQAGKAKET